jgi:hypothetical protein
VGSPTRLRSITWSVFSTGGGARGRWRASLTTIAGNGTRSPPSMVLSLHLVERERYLAGSTARIEGPIVGPKALAGLEGDHKASRPSAWASRRARGRIPASKASAILATRSACSRRTSKTGSKRRLTRSSPPYRESDAVRNFSCCSFCGGVVRFRDPSFRVDRAADPARSTSAAT